MDRSRLVTFAILGLSIALLIAGAVILGIGIHKSKEKKPAPSPPVNPVTCPNQTIPETCSIGSILHFSVLSSLQFRDEYNDINDPFSQKAIQEFTVNMTSILNDTGQVVFSNTPRFLSVVNLAVGNRLQGMTADYLAKSVIGQTYFYGTFVYSANVANPSQLEDLIVSAGFLSATVVASSQKLCGYMEVQPTPAPPNVETTPLDPTITNDDKMDMVKRFLLQIVPSRVDWGTMQMGIGTYYGSNAYLVNNYLCSDINCWKNAVDKLCMNDTTESHNVTRALEFIRDEFSNPSLQLEVGRARSLILMADGFEFDGGFGLMRSMQLRDVLKSSFLITTILTGNSKTLSNTFNQLMEQDAYRLLNVNHWYQVPYQEVANRAMSWICAAQPVTTTAAPKTTIPWTAPIFTEKTSHRPTPGSTTAPILPSACDSLEVLFLVDLAQSIENDFDGLKNYMLNIVSELEETNATFGYIAFNDIVHDQSNGFMTSDDFQTYIQKTVKYINGATRYKMGFSTLSDFYSSYHNLANPTTIVFVTSGYPNDVNSKNDQKFCSDISRTLRQSGAEMIGIVIVPLPDKLDIVQIVLDASDKSLNGSAVIETNSNYKTLPDLAYRTVADFDCDKNSITSICNLDIVFLVEDSEIVSNVGGQYFALGAIESYVKSSQDIGKFTDRIAVVYFSNRNGTNHTLDGRSGVIFDFTSTTSFSPNDIIQKTKDVIPVKPPGSYSDVNFGLQMAANLFGQSPTGNGQAIVIFGRGSYMQGPEQYCCDAPFNTSQALRNQGVIMQGAVIGSDKNATIMSMITGRNNFAIPAFNYDNAETEGQKMVEQLLTFRQMAARNSICVLPEPEPFCTNVQDVNLIIHIPPIGKNELFPKVIKFASDSLINVLGGLDYGSVKDRLTRVSVITYYGTNITTVINLVDAKNSSSVRKAIEGIPLVQHNSTTCKLSMAYNVSLDDFKKYGRSYASQSVLVITEGLDGPDVIDAKASLNLLNANGVAVFGLGTSPILSDFQGLSTTWNQYTLIDGNLLQPSNGKPSVETANYLRDLLCNNYPGFGTTVIPPTIVPVTPTIDPGLLPQGSLASRAWPDITIVLEVTDDLISDIRAVNDRGFEVLRMFLVNTLIRYKIGDSFTKVALLTFDGNAKVEFLYSANSDWQSLYKALTEDWQYGPSSGHTSDKNLDNALLMVRDQIYAPTNGFRGGDQYLWIFTAGPGKNQTSPAYPDLLNSLGAQGVTVYTVGLGNQTIDYMSTFGTNYVIVPNYVDPLNGMASMQDLIGPLLYQTSTDKKVPPQPIPRLSSDVILAIDLNMQSDKLTTLKTFLTKFTASFTINNATSRFAIVTFSGDSVVTTLNLKDGIDKTLVLNTINSIQPVNATVEGTDFNNPLDTIVTTFSTVDSGRRSQSSSFVIFATASMKSSRDVSKSQLDTLHTIYNSTQVLCLSVSDSPPDIALQLASQEGFIYQVNDGLLDWSLQVSGKRSPIVNFFADIQNVDLRHMQNPYVAIPVTQIQADIVILFDQTELKVEDFESVQQYFKLFANKFRINTMDSQFAAIEYTNRTLNSFMFKDCNDTKCLNNYFEKWHYEDQSPISPSYLTSALDAVYYNLTTVSSGWRQSKTYVLIFSSTRLNLDNNLFSSIERLHSKNMNVTYVDLWNGVQQNSGWFDFYVKVAANDLKTVSSADSQIMDILTHDYKITRFQEAPDLSSIVADFVFVVDVSVGGLSEVQELLQALIRKNIGLTIAPNKARVSVILYNGNGVTTDTIYLEDCDAHDCLSSRITKLKQPPVTLNTDLVAALNLLTSTILTPSSGYRGNQTFITFIARNPMLTTSLDNIQNTISNLQAMKWVNFYAFALTQDELVYSYLRQVIPTVMAPTQIIRTSSINPNSEVISGGNGYLIYLKNVYGSFSVQPTAPPTTPPPVTGPTIIPPTPTPNLVPPFDYPLPSIQSDILVIIDASVSLKQTAFGELKSSFAAYFENFFISTRHGSQFSFLWFDDRVNQNSFNFVSGSDEFRVQQAVSNWTYNTNPANSFDLVGALNYASINIFGNMTGYRSQSTSVIVIASNPTAQSPCSDITRAAAKLPSLANVFGISLGGLEVLYYLECMVSQPLTPFVQTSVPGQFSISSSEGTAMTTFLSSSFATYINGLPYTYSTPLTDVYSDIVFIIDQTAIDYPLFTKIVAWTEEIAGGFTISSSQTKFGVLSFTDEVVASGSFSLTRSESPSDLHTSFSNLVYMPKNTYFDVIGAISYVANKYMTEGEGHSIYKPSAIVVIAANSVVAPFSDFNDVFSVARANKIFGVDVKGEGAFEYLTVFGDPQNVYQTNGYMLLDDMGLKNRLEWFLSTAYESLLENSPIPSHDVFSDIVFIIDSSAAMSQAYFKTLQTSLAHIIDIYNFDLTKFAFVFYGNEDPSTIYLDSYTSKLSLKNAILSLQYNATSSTTAEFDVVSAFNYTSLEVLKRSFRNQALTVVTIGYSTNTSLQNNNCSSIPIIQFPQQTTFFGISMQNTTESSLNWMSCVVSNTANLTTFSPTVPLTDGTDTVAKMKFSIAKGYQVYVDSIPTPMPIDLHRKRVDVYIVIDMSMFTAPGLSKIASFLNSFVDRFNYGKGFGGALMGLYASYERSTQIVGEIDSCTTADCFVAQIDMLNASSTDNQPGLERTLSILANTSLPKGRSGVPKVVLLLLTSPYTSPVNQDLLTTINSQASVFGINIYGYQSVTNEILEINNRNDFAAVAVSGPSALFNDGGPALTRLYSFISQASVPFTVEPKSISSDIIIVVDGSKNMDVSTFALIQKWMIKLIKRLTILPQYTQISLLVYGDQPSSTSFGFNYSSDEASLINLINVQTYQPTNSTEWNIVSAANYVRAGMLVESLGWRKHNTDVFYFAIAPKATGDCTTLLNIDWPNNVNTYAIALNTLASTSEYLACLTGKATNIARTDVYGLEHGTYITSQVLHYVGDHYWEYIHSGQLTPPIPVQQTFVDIVFIVDATNSNFDTPNSKTFTKVNNLIISIVQQFQLGETSTRIAVVTCDSDIQYNNTFGLTGDGALQELANRTFIPGADTPFNMNRAIEYTLNNIYTDHPSTKSAVTFIIAGNSDAIPVNAKPNRLQSKGTVFGLDIYNLGAWKYLEQVVTDPLYLEKTSDVGQITTASAIFSKMTYTVSESYNKAIASPFVPTRSIVSDVLFVVDTSSALTTSMWNTALVPSLVNLISAFNQYTQFGILFYDTSVRFTSINLSTPRDKLLAQLQQMTFVTSTSLFDPTGALQHANDVMLTSKNGYRRHSANIILVGFAGKSDTNCSSYPVPTVKVPVTGIAFTLASTQPEQWIKCFVNEQSSIAVTSAFAPISSSVYQYNVVVNSVANVFYKYFQSTTLNPPYDLSDKAVDLVFVVDLNDGTNIDDTMQVFNFISSYISNFTINGSDDSTRVAVVGAGSKAIPWFQLNTYTTMDVLQAAIMNITVNTSMVETKPNLYDTMYYVRDSTLKISNGRREYYPAIIVLILSSETIVNADGLSSDFVYTMNQEANVFGINIYGFPQTSSTIFALNQQKLRGIGYTSQFSDLLDEGSPAISQLSSFISNSHNQFTVPLYDVRSDVIFVLDASAALSEDNFRTVISWMTTAAEVFIINENYVQFALLPFADKKVGSPIVLNGADTLQELQDRLRKAVYPNSTSSVWNLSGALSEVSSTFLRESQGWRKQSTTVVLMAFNSVANINMNTTFPENVELFGINFNPAEEMNYLETLINIKGQLVAIEPTNFLIDSYASLRTLDAISINYQTFIDNNIMEPIVSPQSVVVDVVFIIDETVWSTAEAFTAIQDYIGNLMSSYDFVNGLTRVGYVRFGNSLHGSGTLGGKEKVEQIIKLNYTAYNETIFNIEAALLFTANNILRDSNSDKPPSRPSLIIIFAASPVATDFSMDTRQQIDSMSSVFGLDLRGQGARTYLNTICGGPANVAVVYDPSTQLRNNTLTWKKNVAALSNAFSAAINNPVIASSAVVADVIFVIDLSATVTESQYSSLINSIINIVNDYTLSPKFTRFGVVFGENNYTIALDQLSDRDSWISVLKSISFNGTSSTTFDLNKAVNTVNFLKAKETGGRSMASTTVIVLGSTDQLTSKCNGSLFPSYMNVFGIAFKSQTSAPENWLRCVVHNPSDVVVVPFATNLTNQQYQFNAVTYFINTNFWLFLYERTYVLPTPLQDKKVDLFFVIEGSHYTQNALGTTILPWISNFANHFSIGDKTQVSVLGMGPDSLDTWINLTQYKNIGDLQKGIQRIVVPDYSGVLSGNLWDGTEQLNDLLLSNNNGRRQNTPAVVVYMLASNFNNATTVDGQIVNSVTSEATVFGYSLYGYQNANSAVLRLTGGDAYSLSILRSPLNLKSPYGEKGLQSVISSAQPLSLPLRDINSDIVFIVDTSPSMDTYRFTKVIQWIITTVQQFYLNPASTQVAVVGYSKTALGSSILLNSADTVTLLTDRLNSMISTYKPSNSSFDITGALNYVTTNVFKPSQGWRRESSTVVVVTIDSSISYSSACNQPSSGGIGVVTLSLNSQQPLNVIKCLSTKNYYTQTDSSQLLPNATSVQRTWNNIARSYNDYIASYPYKSLFTPYPVAAQIVIVVDETSWVASPDVYNQMKNMLDVVVSSFSEFTDVAIVRYAERSFIGSTILQDIKKTRDYISTMNYNTDETEKVFNAADAVITAWNILLNEGNTQQVQLVLVFAVAPSAMTIGIENKERLKPLIFGVDTMSYGASSYLPLITGDLANTVSVRYQGDLVRGTVGFQKIQYFITTQYQKKISTPKISPIDVNSDIVFLVDVSNEVNEDQFNAARSSLITLLDDYSIGKLARVGVVFYSYAPGEKIQSIDLNQYDSKYALKNAINKISYEPTIGTFDIVRAAQYVTDTSANGYLSRSRGFREGALSIVILSGSRSTTVGNFTCGTALFGDSNVVGISFTGNYGTDQPQYLQCITTPSYAFSTWVYGNAIVGGADQQLITRNYISEGYWNYMEAQNYDIETPLSEKAIDLVFVIDRSIMAASTLKDYLLPFLTHYISHFTISSQFAQISIIDVIGSTVTPWTLLSANATTINSLLANPPNPSPNFETSVDLGKVAEFVSGTVLTGNNRRNNVAAGVVLLIATPYFSNDADYSYSVTAMNRMSTVFGMNVYGHPETSEALLGVNNGNGNLLGEVHDVDRLTLTSTAVKKMSSALSIAPPQKRIPSDMLEIDFVFVLDVTENMNGKPLKNTLEWIVALSHQLTISPTYSQIAIVTVGNNVSVAVPFASSRNPGAFRQSVRQIITDNSVKYDALSANTLISQQLLKGGNWRGQTTVVLYIANSPQANMNETCSEFSFGPSVNKFAISLNNANSTISYLKCLVGGSANMGKSDGSSFKIDSTASNLFLDYSTTVFKNYVDNYNYSLALPMTYAKSVLWIVIDQTSYLSEKDFVNVKKMLISLMNEYSPLPGMAFFSIYPVSDRILQSNMTMLIIGDAIEQLTNLPYAKSTATTFDLKTVVETILAGPSTMYAVPAQILFVTASPSSTISLLKPDVLNQLRSRLDVFTIDIKDYGASYNYLLPLVSRANNAVTLQDSMDILEGTKTYQQLKSFITHAVLNGYIDPILPADSVQSDVVIAVDLGGISTANFFNLLITNIKNFIGQFIISPTQTRIAIVFFGNSVYYEAALNSWTTLNELNEFLDHITYDPTNADPMDFNAFIQYSNSVILQSNNGFRGQALSMIIVTTSNQSGNCNLYPSTAPSYLSVLSIATTDNYPAWGLCLTQSPILVNYLKINDTTNSDYVLRQVTLPVIFNNLEYIRNADYPINTPLSSVNADIVFIIDETAFGGIDFADIKSSVVSFASLLPKSSFSVVGATSTPVVHFDFTTGNSAAVSKLLEGVSVSEDTDLNPQLELTVDQVLNKVLQKTAGWRGNTVDNPTFVISLLATTQGTPLPSAKSALLSTKSSVFGVDLYGYRLTNNLLLSTNGNYVNRIVSTTKPSDLLNTNTLAYKMLTSFLSGWSNSMFTSTPSWGTQTMTISK